MQTAKTAHPSSVAPHPWCKALHVAFSVACQTLNTSSCDNSTRHIHGDGETPQRRADRGGNRRFFTLTGVRVEEFGKRCVGEAGEGGPQEGVGVYLQH